MHPHGTGSAPSGKSYSTLQPGRERPSGRGKTSSRHVEKEPQYKSHLRERDYRRSFEPGLHTNRARSVSTTVRKHPEKIASVEPLERLDSEVDNEIVDVHDNCYGHMRHYRFEAALLAIHDMESELNIDWGNIKDFGEQYNLLPDTMKKIDEINNIKTSLGIIIKFPPQPLEGGNESAGENKLHRVRWQRDLPEDSSSPDCEELCNYMVFIDHYLLNNDLHNDRSDAAVIDRLKAARNHLIWIQNSRSLSRGFHSQWLGCYSRICTQLIEKDPDFAKSEEGQQAKKIAELNKAVSSAQTRKDALGVLKEQHKKLLNEGVTREAAVMMGCGSKVFNDKWIRSRHCDEEIVRQKNTFFYGYGLLIFGFKCNWKILQGKSQGAIKNTIDRTAGNIHSLGKLSIPILPRQKAMRDFADEVIRELSFSDEKQVWKETISKYLAKYCSILLQDGWQAATAAIDKGEFQTAREHLKGSGELPPYEQHVVDILKGWCYLKEGDAERATQCLQNHPKIEKESSSHLEAIRLYLAAGDTEKASRMIDEANSKVHLVRQIAYDQLKEQIEPARKRSLETDHEPESTKAKRKRIKEPTKSASHLQEKVKDLEQKLKDEKMKSDRNIASHVNEVKKLTEINTELEKQLKEARECQNEQTVRENDQQLKLEKYKAEISDLEISRFDIEGELAEMRGKLLKEQNLTQYYENKQAEQGEQISRLTTELGQLIKGFTPVVKRAETVCKRFTELDNKVREIKEKIKQEFDADLEDELNAVTIELLTEVNDFERKLKDSEKCNADLQIELQQIRQDNVRISNKLEQAECSIEALTKVDQRLSELRSGMQERSTFLPQDQPLPGGEGNDAFTNEDALKALDELLSEPKK